MIANQLLLINLSLKRLYNKDLNTISTKKAWITWSTSMNIWKRSSRRRRKLNMKNRGPIISKKESKGQVSPCLIELVQMIKMEMQWRSIRSWHTNLHRICQVHKRKKDREDSSATRRRRSRTFECLVLIWRGSDSGWTASRIWQRCRSICRRISRSLSPCSKRTRILRHQMLRHTRCFQAGFTHRLRWREIPTNLGQRLTEQAWKGWDCWLDSSHASVRLPSCIGRPQYPP